jgi:hypothetical protein
MNPKDRKLLRIKQAEEMRRRLEESDHTGNCGPRTVAHEESLTRDIALRDWLRVPVVEMAKELEVTINTIRAHRTKTLYLEVIDELRKDWRERINASPATRELRNDIAHGMGVAVHRCIRIVSSSKSRDGDAISAAKLLAQLDGRFLSSDPDAPAAGDKTSDKTESIAAELLKAMGKDTVQ